ncbi:MAG: response regulator [Gemmatimonadetes bacterium]|jgi:DNA-binding response OmpR family regulator|nr:response regulator [Gemmatimonadota bacterium]MBT5057610.1 response regulator [Gemmatimonadota bacterium]MBT5142656.1 response regulator [Gemmatimonadota bacterium]MBT5587632.1 response regulator [Gemmatimonadota bacterium]MBT5960554.1 response regulator [Gemmatimonadota bacterium]
MKILLVDDNADVRMTLAAMLSRLGYEVTSVESAEAAFERLAANPIDLILSDYNLPDVDGVELLRRANGMVPGLVSIIASGIAPPGHWDHIDDWLIKPLPFGELKHRLEAAVAKREDQRTADGFG